MKRSVLIFVAATLFAACAESATSPADTDLLPAFSATTTRTNLRDPFAANVFVPCANNGVGEIVSLTGTLHILLHVTVDETGGVHVKSHFQPQNLAGVGMTTGDSYRGTGVTQQTDNISGDGLPFEFTFVNNFRVIGQGPGNNFLIHQNVHGTINANGELTAAVDNFRAECE